MKNLASIALIFMTATGVICSESALTTTYQPLDGLGSGAVEIVQVTCHHWYANSVGSAVDLIHRPNVPPTDNPAKATRDLNLASLSGLRFSTNDLGDKTSAPLILLDATKFDDSKLGGYEKEVVVRASLECLRRCLPEKLKTIKVTLECQDSNRAWLSKIVSDFNTAARNGPFYKSE